MQPPIASLVKYDNSVLVSSSKDKKGKGTPGKKVSWRKSNFDVRRHLSFCASFARFPSYISFSFLIIAGISASSWAKAWLDTNRRYPQLHSPTKVLVINLHIFICMIAKMTLYTLAQGMDRGGAALGSICVEHTSNTPRCYQPSGKARPAASAASGQFGIIS